MRLPAKLSPNAALNVVDAQRTVGAFQDVHGGLGIP